MKIIKRNGSEVVFDITKIIIAITRANESVPESDRMTPVQIQRIAQSVEIHCQQMGRSPTVEKIQDLVEHQIMAHGAFEVAKSYITYRYTRSLVRKSNTTDDKILALFDKTGKESGEGFSEQKPVVNSDQRDYIASVVSRDITSRLLLPQDIAEAHSEGLIHFHDAGYFIQRMQGPTLIDLAEMLQNGTILSGICIEKPQSFDTACSVAIEIIAQVSHEQYGGQTVTLSHLSPFIQMSRDRLRNNVRNEFDNAGIFADNEKIASIAEKRLREEIRRGIQTILYQSAILPDSSDTINLFMDLGEVETEQERSDLALLIEETLLQRIQGVKDPNGNRNNPESPRLVYVLDDNNLLPGSSYQRLTELAARCAAKWGSPVFFNGKKMRQLISTSPSAASVPCSERAALLPPYEDESGMLKYYGRFDQGMVTINLTDVALSSGGNFDQFWKLLEERLELCHRALLCRHQRLKGTMSDAAPVLWQHGACSRIRSGVSIDKLLFGGYSTLSLGFVGLRECVRAMTGKSHTDPSATPFALQIMNVMSGSCRRWTSQQNVCFALCGSDSESVCRRLAYCLRKRFGSVDGITSESQISGSFHFAKGEIADPLLALEFESQFQRLSPGGSFCKVSIPGNPADAMELLSFFYNHAYCAVPVSVPE